MKSSSNELDCNKFSPNEPRFDEKKEEMIRDNRKKKITHKSLRNDEKRLRLKIEKRTFKTI